MPLLNGRDSNGNIIYLGPQTTKISRYLLVIFLAMSYEVFRTGYAQGVAVDSAGKNVYVVDTYNHRIQKFNSDGTFIAKWGNNGKAEGQFSYPAGVAVDSAGNVYVAETYNNRIQKFDSNGTFIANWYVGPKYHPNGVAVDSTRNVYVADYETNILQEFNSDGGLIATLGSGGSGNATLGSGGSGNGLFEAPSSVAVDCIRG